MAFIDPDGLMQSEPGDFLQVTHLIRPNDYGAMITPDGRPAILVWHLTGNDIPRGCDTADQDGTRGMAGRIASGVARYYAHLYLGRDGHAFQVVPFNRCAIHVAGKYQGREINRIASGIEITNAGWARPNGAGPGFAINPAREDWRRSGALLWHMLTLRQNSAVLELGEAWRRWTQRPVEDCLRGHHDVDPDSTHADPGPDFRPFLIGPLKAHLEAMTP